MDGQTAAGSWEIRTSLSLTVKVERGPNSQAVNCLTVYTENKFLSSIKLQVYLCKNFFFSHIATVNRIDLS